MPFHFGPLEVGIVLVIILLVFGAGRLPALGAGLGKSLREFRQSLSGASRSRPPPRANSRASRPVEH
ncbi:MAG: twin-arginine translocase TatA/TatE family subunit [Chloroflexi bacterium]|nr:twin-arginine translocase TatA/TatE family subunit [Chloroflexota bacterium]